jgi:hypothetical protein
MLPVIIGQAVILRSLIGNMGVRRRLRHVRPRSTNLLVKSALARGSALDVAGSA